MIEFICPKCKRPLKKAEGAYKCADGHSYDVAREGYVNLLLANKKNSQNPGDNKLMVAARAAFLNKGYYGFLADKLTSIVKEYAAGRQIDLLDAGCGTGYYLRHILEGNDGVTAVGADISKEAAKVAAKADKRADFAVAGVFDLPFADKTFDIVTCVFSPYAYAEYARVLKDNGILVLVYPAAKHLFEIKRELYGDKAYENEKSPSSDCFAGIKTIAVENTFTASGDDVVELLTMTPYFYKTKPEDIEKLKAAGESAITASFEIAILTK